MEILLILILIVLAVSVIGQTLIVLISKLFRN